MCYLFITYLWSSHPHHLKCQLPSLSRSSLKKMNTKTFLKKNMNNSSRKWKLKRNKMKRTKLKEDKTLTILFKKREKRSESQKLSWKTHLPSFSRKTPSPLSFSNGSRNKFKDQLQCSTHQSIGPQSWSKK